MEYYSVIKRNVLLILLTIWMNLKIKMLIISSQTQKDYIIYNSIYIKF